MRKNKLIIVAIFFLKSIYGFAQNKTIADSCWNLYITEKTGNDSLQLNRLAEVAFNQVNADSLIYYSDFLINKSLAKNNSVFLAKGYYYKSVGLFKKSKNELALELLIKCINEASSSNDKKLISIAYSQMGNVYSSINNWNYSTACYLKAIEFLKSEANKSALAGVYLNLGSNYYTISKLDSALHYYNLSDSLYSKVGDKLSGAYVKGNIGILQAKRKQYIAARINLLDANKTLLQVKHYQAAVTYKLWLSIIEQKARNHKLALTLASECLKTAKDNQIKDQIRDSYEQLSVIYDSLGRYNESNKALKQFYAYRDSIVNTETITQMANLRTEFEVGQKQAELDAMAENERFKTLIAWILLVALSSVALLLVIVYRNYQHTKHLLAKLKTQKTDLELANETKDRFFSVISHDLRGPMGAIGNLVLLANDAIVDNRIEELKVLLNMMGHNSHEIESLLNNLLHWSVGQRGAYQRHHDTLNFTQLINNVIKIYQPIALAKVIRLTFTPAMEEHMVMTDPNSWAVIVRNLVNNAIKFTHTGGRVEITASQQGNLLVLKVSDTGIGMEKSVVENLFKSSVNLPQWGTNYEKGMGIGLSLIKDFVDINDGEIEVLSVLGKGTTFTIMIPVGQAKEDHLQLDRQLCFENKED